MTQTKRNILLIEPGYKNKYPPIGLMKIATYHRMLGDNVRFFKGEIKDFVLDELTSDCMERLQSIDNTVQWLERSDAIRKYIQTKQSKALSAVLLDYPTPFESPESQYPLLEIWLKHFSDYYKKKKYVQEPKWDRIYVTTLFTFYWKITIRTIEAAKALVKDVKELKVGGVLASLLADEVEETTGIKTMQGLLDTAGVLDNNNYIIDDLPLDYSILDEINYKYPTGSAYFTFMTKGCTRTCAFCSVPVLEPTYKEKIPTIGKFQEIKELYGEQQHLLLMDNNVLASPKFPEIIQEIKDMGFVKGAKFLEPNQLDLAIKNLSSGMNDRAYIRRSFTILDDFLKTRLNRNKKAKEEVNVIYQKYNLLKLETLTKDNLLAAYPKLKDYYEKHRLKSARDRYVDFNQGTDARYVTDENMKLLSEIPINPLRIAFDYWGMKKKYENAIRLAAKYKITKLSNYLLFNFKDRPEDLYNRMQINVELSEELNIYIYSFPMKYIPLFGEEAKDRKFVGKFWNKKFIRGIQAISNATRGIVPPGRSFFEEAFGKDVEEYFELLYMPETYIIYRKLFKELKFTEHWQMIYRSFEPAERTEANNIIAENDFTNLEQRTSNSKILKLLQHYTITRNQVNGSDDEYKSLKEKYDLLIATDQFIDLTLTYDYEDRDESLVELDSKKQKKTAQVKLF